MNGQQAEKTIEDVASDGERLTEMLATVSHELRTPAALIVGLAATLAESRDRMSSAQVTDAFQRLERQAGRLVRLLDDMLDVSKIKAGHKLDLALQEVDLEHAVERAILSSAQPGHVSIKRMMPAGTKVWSDPNALERAIVNLLRNAFRYGGPNVTVEAKLAHDGVAFAVSDDGPGVSPDLRQHLFEPFNASRGGTGLGLAIVKAVAEGSGGEAAYESLAPSGSRFTMRLRDEPGPRPAPRAKALGDVPKQPFTILIVDDEPDVLFLLRMTLQHGGYEVEEAPHGGAALEMIDKVRPDLVITDLMMPVVDGRELIQRIRDESAYAATPIMLLSASPDDNTGADRVLRKPFDPRHLMGVIEELVGKDER